MSELNAKINTNPVKFNKIIDSYIELLYGDDSKEELQNYMDTIQKSLMSKPFDFKLKMIKKQPSLLQFFIDKKEENQLTDEQLDILTKTALSVDGIQIGVVYKPRYDLQILAAKNNGYSIFLTDYETKEEKEEQIENNDDAENEEDKIKIEFAKKRKEAQKKKKEELLKTAIKTTPEIVKFMCNLSEDMKKYVIDLDPRNIVYLNTDYELERYYLDKYKHDNRYTVDNLYNLIKNPSVLTSFYAVVYHDIKNNKHYKQYCGVTAMIKLVRDKANDISYLSLRDDVNKLNDLYKEYLDAMSTSDLSQFYKQEINTTLKNYLEMINSLRHINDLLVSK